MKMKKRYLLTGLALIATGIFGVITISILKGPNFINGGTGGMMRRMMENGMMNNGMMNGMGGMMGRRGMMGDMMRNMEEIERKTKFSSNGERIFYTGTNSRGKSIKNSNRMEGVGCAMCHGTDARGMQMMMMDVPELRWSYLSDPDGHIHPNGRRHPPFTEGSFKACVLAGFDPGGNQLNTMMPRWEMSEEDLNDLIEYLKTK